MGTSSLRAAPGARLSYSRVASATARGTRASPVGAWRQPTSARSTAPGRPRSRWSPTARSSSSVGAPPHPLPEARYETDAYDLVLARYLPNGGLDPTFG